MNGMIYSFPSYWCSCRDDMQMPSNIMFTRSQMKEFVANLSSRWFSYRTPFLMGAIYFFYNKALVFSEFRDRTWRYLLDYPQSILITPDSITFYMGLETIRQRATVSHYKFVPCSNYIQSPTELGIKDSHELHGMPLDLIMNQRPLSNETVKVVKQTKAR